MEHSVLVVEDDLEINELLGEYLALENIRYISALDGKSGIEQVQQSSPDAAILDLMLPDIDGYEVCKFIASHRATVTIPVIILTCMNQDCDRIKGLATGAFRFMNKPFLPDDLIEQVRQAFVWRRNVTLRPPCGQIEISTHHPGRSFQQIHDMIVDLFVRSQLSETAINTLRDGFALLADWAFAWANATRRDPHLLIHYRLNAESGELAAKPDNGSAELIEWTISEPEPALLADTLFKPLPPVNTLAAMKLTASTGNSPLNDESASPLGPWYQFLGKTGVSRFEKDSKIGQVRLARSLKPEPLTDLTVPVVTIDGCRVPNRVRTEAGPKRK